MIAIDSSALIAVIMMENDAEAFVGVLASGGGMQIGTPTLFETYQVAKGKKGSAGRGLVDDLVSASGIEVCDWTRAHLAVALDAFDRYGKGSGHMAALNFGDCMAYAIAKVLSAPLLYKGDDFAATDIRSAL